MVNIISFDTAEDFPSLVYNYALFSKNTISACLTLKCIGNAENTDSLYSSYCSFAVSFPNYLITLFVD